MQAPTPLVRRIGNAVVRDFRDAKAMAQSLREALADIGLSVTHSQSLELIAKALDCKNWNVLASLLLRSRHTHPPDEAGAGTSLLYCSFCRRSQHDVKRLLAGPARVFICDECVEMSAEALVTAEFDAAVASNDPGEGFRLADDLSLAAYFDGRSSDQIRAWLAIVQRTLEGGDSQIQNATDEKTRDHRRRYYADHARAKQVAEQTLAARNGTAVISHQPRN